MDTIALRNQLLQAKNSRHFVSEAKSIVDSLKKEGAGLESVTVILKFMEEHPAFDFGAPGPLAHFVEKFHLRGYETELLASIARRPTVATLSLLNVLINGTKKEADRERFIDVFRQVESHSLADDEMKRLAGNYLQSLSS